MGKLFVSIRVEVVLCFIVMLAASDAFWVGLSRDVSLATCHRQQAFGRAHFRKPRFLLKGNQGKGEKVERLSKENLASMLEKAFVEGVMQLSQGYVETLKLFIAAALTGYGMSIPLKNLLDLVEFCPAQSANRPLMEEEEDLRATWIKLVYTIAQNVEYRSTVVKDAQLIEETDIDDSTTWNAYRTILPRLREKHEEGNETGPKFNADQILQENAALLSPLTQEPFQKALLLQNLRVMWITLTVIEEEKLCLSDQEPPAPPIPNKLDS